MREVWEEFGDNDGVGDEEGTRRWGDGGGDDDNDGNGGELARIEDFYWCYFGEEGGVRGDGGEGTGGGGDASVSGKGSEGGGVFSWL